MFNIYQQPIWIILALLIIVTWTLIWKGLGLWHAARNKQKSWFVVILIFNTMGLLPIIYLLWFKPKTKVEKSISNGRITKKTMAKKSKAYPKPRRKKK
tara:strand:+ start:396 stop:689 length:294 start_codon:yes stop_codon:yes gene_type:complete